MGDALAPWHIIILVVVLVVLFGAKRLPGAAQSLGQSMHIFKKSVRVCTKTDQPFAAGPGGLSASGTLPPSAAGSGRARPDSAAAARPAAAGRRPAGQRQCGQRRAAGRDADVAAAVTAR